MGAERERHGSGQGAVDDDVGDGASRRRVSRALDLDRVECDRLGLLGGRRSLVGLALIEAGQVIDVWGWAGDP